MVSSLLLSHFFSHLHLISRSSLLPLLPLTHLLLSLRFLLWSFLSLFCVVGAAVACCWVLALFLVSVHVSLFPLVFCVTQAIAE